MAARVILSLLFLPVALAEKWAVIAAGSQGFMNYRHQADACHAYQIMLKSGVPAANIILMMQDDVAKSSENPFPGQLFNKPGNASLDVYKGCKVDYSGDIVTAQLFLDVLTGKGKGKVLKSTEKDTVFVNFVDHGGPGIVAFPNGPFLHVKDLSKTLETMQSQKMFNQLVFYMEACESGSMLPDLKDDGKILAVTASNGKESSWGTYCGDEAVVKGKNIGSCLGDLFSVNWMEDDDLGKLASETFRSQISKVTKLTNKSHVCSFGDKSFEDEAIGRVEGALISDVFSDSSKGAVDARDIYVTQAYWAWQNAAVDQKEKAWARFVGIVNDRERDDQLFATMGRQACAGSTKVQLDECQQSILGDRAEMKDMDCHKKLATLVHEHCPVSSSHHATGGWNGYNMKFSQVLLNLCEHQEELGQSVDQLAQIVEEECSKVKAVVTEVVV
ncbi:Vacuolar-processing enzyme delta-isozyme (Delta-VPE) (Asparaginyl endopeptidase delta-VPE) [Durusdinium trenchii]|uniref:Vacuolar-processing enzyme delta-isozyme (Delta-VPE) (Asparaginyl endopeptidase delta-VPE) n=1 Tax=Durusdinium trenchii TaxID=1381693 RepID=A0ABP0I4E8_9DINO